MFKLLAVTGAAAACVAALAGCATTHATTEKPEVPVHQIPWPQSGGPSQQQIAPWLAPLLTRTPQPSVPPVLALFFPAAPSTPVPSADATPDRFMQILTNHSQK